MPTGIALRDAREQLFDAAERVLLRAGPGALTSRAVTSEAGVAKGVLHRHFGDFDGFLADLVLDRIARVESQSAALRDRAGTGTVAGNLAGALIGLFDPVALAIVALIISRDGLRLRLRRTGNRGVPVLGEATAMIAAYLAAERQLGRVALGADVDAVAPMLIGTGHLLFASSQGTAPEVGVVEKAVATATAGIVRTSPG